MKHSRLFVWIIVAASLGLLLITLSSLIGRPSSSIAAPMLQIGETEPNDDFDNADYVNMPGYVTGKVHRTSMVTDTVDYFVMDTQVSRQYQASLTIISNPEDVDLQIKLYDADRSLIGTSSSSSSYTSISWTAYTDTHYTRIEAIVGTITESFSVDYRLDLDELAATPTSTNTPVPSMTPSPTSTPIAEEDNYEENDEFTQAYTLPVGTLISLSDLYGVATFYPLEDEDWFKYYAKDDFWYEVSTSDLNQCDTYIEIRDRDDRLVDVDDDGGGGYSSLVSWQAGYDGYYYIRVLNKVNTTGSYDMTVMEIEEPPTVTPGPSPTSGPGPDPEADDCEDNLSFERACVIPVNAPQDFNFVPPFDGVDNDFFQVWVKPGLIYECYTSDLDPGVDPNMILFSGPSWDQAIGGNDDVEPGDFNCAFTYFATYEGWLYILVGTGERTPPDVYASDYTLTCEMRAPGETSTPTPRPTSTPDPPSTPDDPTNTPAPSPSPTPARTPTESAGLIVRPLATPTPPPPPGTPSLRFVPVDLLVYYDANNDHNPGAGEGVAGILALAFDTVTGEQIAQGFTDELGHLQFTAAAQGAVRLSIPYLGVSQLIGSEGASVYVRISPLPLPEFIP